MDLRDITITDSEFRQLSTFIKSNYGINLKEKKRTLVIARLYNILKDNNFQSFSEYFDYVRSDKTGEALSTLINKITTNHTFFMREPEHFDYLRNTVLPYLKKMCKTGISGYGAPDVQQGRSPTQ
jgi:chemotaxis protein methyltransferase CheR